MTIRPAMVNGQRLTEDDISRALAEVGQTFGLSAGEVHQRVIGQGIDRRSAAGWVVGIRAVHDELRAAASRPAPSASGGTADMIAEYTTRFPPVDAAGNRLCLTAGNGNRPAMSDADAASEISRLCLTHGSGPRVRFDMQKVAASAITAREAPVGLSQERLYDADSELRLTAPVSGQAEADAEVARLAGSSHGGKFLDLARHDLRDSTGSFTPAAAAGHSTSPYVAQLDSGAPSVSDLSGQLSPANQSYSGATFSPFAQAEFNALPDSSAAAIQAELDTANEADHPSDAASALVRAMAHAGSSGHLRRELGQRAQAAVTAAASFIPAPGDAQVQAAGGMTADQVAAEMSRLSSQAAAPRTGNTTGNLSRSPLSPAAREAAEQAARPGHTSAGPSGFGFGRTIPQLHG